jgi:hypothetical protein
LTSLEVLRGLAGRRDVIALAATLPSEEEAFFLVGAVGMLARVHERGRSL